MNVWLRGLKIVGLGVMALGAAVLVFSMLGIALLWFGAGEPDHDGVIRLYSASRVITIDPERPFADAVAVADGKILAVGSRAEVEQALSGRPFTVDDRFSDKIVMPGFIDPHVHPSLAATVLQLHIVSAMEWLTPDGRTIAVRGRDAFLARLAELADDVTDEARGDLEAADSWLFIWGYHEPYHGALSRVDLDKIATERPIAVWQRSCHEMFFNSSALRKLDLTESDFEAEPNSDWETGHVWETGLFALGGDVIRELAAPGRYRAGLSMMSEIIHRGGLTTVADMGFPQIHPQAELLMLHVEMHGDETPYRYALVPNASFLVREEGDAVAAERKATEMLDWSTDRVRVLRHVKYYADGAIFSQLMQMTEPYLDGHQGEWMMEPASQQAVLETFWSKGWSIHVHVNGDAGLDLVLDQVESVVHERPADPGQRIIMEHYGYAREDQHLRVAALGVEVSNNAYYAHELPPIYAEHGLGPDRAEDISPLGGLARAGVPFSFHSDYPMAPAEPLRLAWVAVNRIATDGKTWGEDQRIALDLALRAVTIEGARSLGLEREIGSIEVGKRADFTILEHDPYRVPATQLADIPIWGTMLGGRLHPLPGLTD